VPALNDLEVPNPGPCRAQPRFKHHFRHVHSDMETLSHTSRKSEKIREDVRIVHIRTYPLRMYMYLFFRTR
jgi:hypothetical protein